MSQYFVVLCLFLASCALRPRYADFVSKSAVEKEARLVLLGDNGQPVPNAKLEMSDGKNRFSQMSDSEGLLRLPVDKKYLDENPVLVVTLPPSVQNYRLQPYVAPPPAVLESPPAPMDSLSATPDSGTP
jgi:hypothetical protein